MAADPLPSLQFERMITYILLRERYSAEHVGSDSSVSDVRVLVQTPDLSHQFFVEVKMGAAQFGSGRIWFDGSHWRPTTETDPMARFVAEIMDLDRDAASFVAELRSYLGRDLIKLVRTKSRKRYDSDQMIVRPDELSQFLTTSGRDQDVALLGERDVSGLIRDHYMCGKAKPAPYMQWGNNFYRLTEDDPLGLVDVPLLKNIRSDIRVRAMFASSRQYYNFIPTIDPKEPVGEERSPFSIVPWTGKRFPFPASSNSEEFVRPAWLAGPELKIA